MRGDPDICAPSRMTGVGAEPSGRACARELLAVFSEDSLLVSV